MRSRTALAAGGQDLRGGSVRIANEFIRAYGGAGTAADVEGQVRPREPFDLAVLVVELCASTLERDDAGPADGPAGSGWPARGERPGWDVQGPRMALDGVPMATAVEWLRELERAVTDTVLACPEVTVDEARGGLARIRALFDRLCALELESYTTVSDSLGDWYTRMGTDLVTALASGAPVEPHTVNGQARILNVNPHQPFRAVAVYHEPPPSPHQWARVRRRVLEALRRHDPQREALLSDGTGFLLVLVPVDRPGPGIVEHLGALLRDEELGRTLFVAAGEPGDYLALAGRSCRQALSALEIAIYRGQRGRVVQCTEVILEVLLAHNQWVSNRIVDSRIGCLLQKPHLVETLRAYVGSEMSLQRTADELVVHPNTVAYRLRQIATLTGRDMRKVTHVVDLAVALTAYDVLQMRRDQEHNGAHLRTRLLS